MGEGKPRSRAKELLERAQAKLGRAGEKSARSLRRTRDRVSDALGTAAERIRETEAGERLSAALETQRVVKRALEAQARGNARMAYRLLEEEHRARPDDEKLALAFWNLAASIGRAGEVAPAVLPVVRRRASRGEADEAAKLWLEIVSAVPAARCDAGSLIRIVSALEPMDHDRAVQALRLALDPGTPGLAPGLALRAAELARSLDPPSAAAAARVALASPEIDATKRQRLAALVRELERDPPPAEAAAPAEGAEEAFSELVIEPTLEAVDPPVRFDGVKAMEAAPLGLTEEGVRLAVDGGKRAFLGYEKIQAVAVGELAAAPGGVVIDLALNWDAPGQGPLRVVRLRGDRFDPEGLDSEITGPTTLRGFLAQLLSRSDAQPLPDVDAALGDPLHVFDDLDAYQREVLQVG